MVVLVWVLREADANIGLNVQGFYWGNACERENTEQGGEDCELTDCNANVTPSEGEGEVGWECPRVLCSLRKSSSDLRVLGSAQ